MTETPGCLWWTGAVRCAICRHAWVAIVELVEGCTEPMPLECPDCEHYAGQPA